MSSKDLLLPGRWELLGALVVAGKAVDPALNKNEPEFGVLVLPVPLKMLPNGHRLLNQEVQVLRDLRCKPYHIHTLDKPRKHIYLQIEQTDARFSFSPWALRIRRILLPVTVLTRGIPCWSRRRTPICDGIWPFLAALVIISSTYKQASNDPVNKSRQTSSKRRPNRTRNERGWKHSHLQWPS